jgi:GTP-binding protein
MSNKIPIVAIVGRANVGKSSLFNRLVGYRQTVVADEPGTTRDSIYGRVEADKTVFAVVDTAGLKTPDDEFEATIQEQITEAATAADIILVVVEAHVMVTDEDRRVAKLAHRSGKPTVLVINKADQVKNVDLTEFKKLGIKESFSTITTQNQGIRELRAYLAKAVGPVTAPLKDVLRISFIGRPNVGKSSIFNSLAQKQQAIVADVAGTTRDVNRVTVAYHGQEIELLDTAGIRRPGKVERGVEQFSVLRSVAAIEESDICVLVLDAHEPGVALDQKLAGIIKEAGKGLVLAVNKWDDVDKDAFTHDQLTARLQYEFQHVPWAQFLATSAVTGHNITKLLASALDIQKERTKQLKTSQLNQWLGSATSHHPPAGLKNRHPRLKYVTQTDISPVTLRFFGRDTDYLHWSYKRFLERELREAFGFSGTPVRFLFSDGAPKKQKATS